MGIVLHDENEYVMELSVAGSQSVAADLEVMVVPFPGTIRGIFARLDVAPTGAGTQVTDIKITNAAGSQTSIFSGATKLNWAVTSRIPTYGALTTNPTVVAKGDTLSLHTTTAGATAGKNLAVQITIRRNRASAVGTDFDSVSAMSDAV
jgi:hypothetical protein